MSVNRIKKNQEFRNVYRRGKSFSNDLLVIYIYMNRRNKNDDGTNFNRIGISVSKKVGKSVVRSRVKRVIGENYRLNSENLKQGYDIVFIARNKVKDKSYWEVKKAMINLFKKAGLN